MTAPVDEVIHHVGGLLQAALNAYAAGTCKTVAECQPFHGAPPVEFPVLSIWRESEKPGACGTGGRRLRNVIIKAVYELGPRAPANIDAATALLSYIVGVVDDVLEAEKLSTYESGAGLLALAQVTAIGLVGAKYIGAIIESPAGSYPAVELTIACEHYYSRAETGTALVDLLGTVNTSTGLETLSLNSGAYTFTPLVSGVVVVLVWGAALDVAVAYRTVTITFIGGTTTLAATIAKVAADADAVDLLTVGGSATLMPAGTLGGSQTFGLSLPRAQQISTPT
jgi:hypothetical protein